MIPGEVTHIRIDAATKQGIQALALAGHRSFGAEIRWALSWWVENRVSAPTDVPGSLTMPGTFIKVQRDGWSG